MNTEFQNLMMTVFLVLLLSLLFTSTAIASPITDPRPQQADNSVPLGILCSGFLGLWGIIGGLIVRFVYSNFAPRYTNEITTTSSVKEIWAYVGVVFPQRTWFRKKLLDTRVLSAYPLPYWISCLIMLFTGILLGAVHLWAILTAFFLGAVGWFIMGRAEKVEITVMPREGKSGSSVKVDACGYAAERKARELESRLPVARADI